MWIETFDQAGYNADLACPNIRNGFDGKAAMVMSESLAIAATRTSSMIVERRNRHVAADNDDGVTLYLNTGTTRQGGEQFGRTVEAAPDQAYLLTHGASFKALAPAGGEAIGIKLPAAVLAGWRLDPGDLAAQPLDCSGSAYALLRDYARLVVSQGDALDDAAAQAVSRHITELVGLWLGAGPRAMDGNSRDAATGARLTAIRQAIRQQAKDPGLTIGAVALQLGISVRYVQHILALAGENFSQLLTQARLERARLQLLDPVFDALPVSTIGFQCGFSEATSFYRAFKAAYDTTPAALRASRRKDQAGGA